MRIISVATFLFISANLLAQVDYQDIELHYGEYAVGYKNLELLDSSRSYSRIQDYGALHHRPVSVSVWEPGRPGAAVKPVTIRDYLNVLQIEEEWPDLPFDYFFDWFYIPNTEHNARQATYTTQASLNYEPVITNKPVILYSSSFRASSTENFILGEYLASHGYTVIAIPSKGHDNLNFTGGNIKDATAQSDDLAFVISNLDKITNHQTPELYLTGFSFGGLSHIINVFNNSNIKGVISLDGTIKYRPEVTEASVYYDLERFKVPFIHFSQKDIPHHILRAQAVDTLINSRFKFYDEITVPVKYQIKATQLSHTYFAAYGLLFTEKDPVQDPDYTSIANSYEELLDNFRFCLNQLTLEAFDTTSFADKITASGNFEIIAHTVREDPTTFNDFLQLCSGLNLQDINSVYDSLKIADEQFEIAEGDLNTLGLQLIFSPETFLKGENVFKLALRLFPNSGNLYDSLAEGYWHRGLKGLARMYFLKSLEFSPDNQHAKKRLLELE